jgi:hypothetical protein
MLTPCQFKLGPIVISDVTKIVQGRLAEIMTSLVQGSMEQVKSSLNVRQVVSDAWTGGWTSRPVSDGLFVLIQPESLGLSDFGLSGRRLTATVSVVAHPLISAARSDTPIPPLPNKQEGVPLEGSFLLAVPVTASYDELSARLKSQFDLGRGALRYPRVGDPHINLRDVRLYGFGQSVVAKLDFDGASEGWIYLTGTPAFDDQRGLLSFPDLDYSVETKNLLIKALSDMRHEDILHEVRRRLTINVEPAISRVREAFDKAVNVSAEHMQLAGTLDRLTLRDFFANPTDGTYSATLVASGTVTGQVQ